MTLVNATASAHHFSVKLSLFMCMLAACSGLPPQCCTFSSIDAVTVCSLVPRPHLLTEGGGGGNGLLNQIEFLGLVCTFVPRIAKQL